jgi:hypothetical protein
MNNTPMTRLENMTQFLLEHGVNPKKEPINTVLFHLKAAESELAEALSIIDQIRKDVIADESFGQFIQTLFLDPLDAKERELAEARESLIRCSTSHADLGLRMRSRITEVEKQRDKLAEKAQAVAHALFQHGTIGSWCDEAKDLREALAAVKGEKP